MSGRDIDLDEFRDDFVIYLANRLGVPHEVAATYLGNWLLAFAPTSVGDAARSAIPILSEEPEGSPCTAAKAQIDDE